MITSDGYGAFNESTGIWTGIVGDVVSGRSDIGVQTLIATPERAKVIWDLMI